MKIRFWTVLILPAFLGAAVPSWFVSPPESAEKFYFLSVSTSLDKAGAGKASFRKLVLDSSSYLGRHFDRAKLTLIEEAYSKDINSDVHTCYMLAAYPRSDTAEKELSDGWERKKVNKIFTSAVKKSERLASRDKIIEAVTTLSAAKANKLLPELKKVELENRIKELVTRVKIRPLEYPRAGDTKTELRGDIGVLVSVSGRTDQPVKGLNVSFSFAKNSGFIEPVSAMTDKKGLVAVQVKRFNRSGEAVILAGISSTSVPEFSYVAPARFQIQVGGGRIAIMKGSIPVRRGGTKKQNIVFLEDNLPVGVLSLEANLRPETLSISAKLIPTKDISGFIVDKQTHVEGIKPVETSKDFSITVDKINEGDNFSIEVGPFEIIIVAKQFAKEKIKLPLGGEKNTIKQILISYVLFYR